jgi:quinol-cytochrome oxidoreductase complex cytochrome b subunit
VFCIPFAWFAFFIPDILGHPDNYVMANSQVTPAHIVPEWYFLPFYAILRAIDFNFLFIDSKLGGVIAFGGAILVLFFVPWLDRSKVRSGTFRPLFQPFYWLFVVDFVALAYLGAQPAEGIYVVLSKIATAYYFIYFLIVLPLLPRFEQPRALPTSISEAVLAKARS